MFACIVSCSAFWAIALPATFVLIRESTKLHRRGIVEDLIRVFDKKPSAGVTSIPSFEFVKYKYFAFEEEESNLHKPRADFLVHQWVLSAVPLVLITFTLNAICLSIVVRGALAAPIDLDVRWLGDAGPAPLFAWVVLASYVGAMLFMLRAFRQAINNFDLSPFSLVGASVNLIASVAASLLLVFGVARIPAAAGLDLAGPAGFPLTLVAAFTAGYLPNVAIRNVLRWSNLRLRKTENEEVYKSFKSIPLEIIDGIDSETSSRFEDYHINTVQNLATANPLMLFVETPYGVYQIMDWVAQAQLCATVGPTALVALWRLGIRTIFDLERVALDERCRAPQLTEAIGAILWAEPGRDLAGQPIVPDQAAIEADIRFRLENPHVLRLRQIFNDVSDSIGDDARRLAPVADGAPGDDRPGPAARPRAA